MVHPPDNRIKVIFKTIFWFVFLVVPFLTTAQTVKNPSGVGDTKNYCEYIGESYIEDTETKIFSTSSQDRVVLVKKITKKSSPIYKIHVMVSSNCSTNPLSGFTLYLKDGSKLGNSRAEIEEDSNFGGGCFWTVRYQLPDEELSRLAKSEIVRLDVSSYSEKFDLGGHYKGVINCLIKK